MKKAIKFTFIVLPIIAVIIAVINWPIYGFTFFGIFLMLLGFYDMFQKEHAVLRNFPIIGHVRFLLELIGPEIHQYFVESDTDGTPIDRNHRSYIYQRAKEVRQTHPFGTELNVNGKNYKWMKHSIYPAHQLRTSPRVIIGGSSCTQPYSASLFNISAMSLEL